MGLASDAEEGAPRSGLDIENLKDALLVGEGLLCMTQQKHLHAHKGLASELELAAYDTECHSTWSVQRSPDSGGQRLAGGAIYAWLHPNFMINRYGPIMDTNLVLPLGHDRCEVRYDYFFRETEGEAAQTFIRESLKETDSVQLEDVGLCALVQRGLRSSSYEFGVYAKTETSMLLFHQLLSADLGRLAKGGAPARP